MLNSIITILLIIILAPVILTAGFIALMLIVCVPILIVMAIAGIIIAISEKISKTIKKKTNKS